MTTESQKQSLADKYADASWVDDYSPNHEFWYSSGASFLFHFILILVLPLLAVVFRPVDRLAPSVEVVVVDDSRDATGAADDELPSTDKLNESAGETSSEDTPSEVEDVPLTEVTVDPVEDPTDVVALADNGSKAAAAQNAVARAKKMLDKNLGGSGGGGAGDPGGGSGGSGRSGRAARWVINFNRVDVRDYLGQLEGLGAEVAFPGRGDDWTYFRNLTAPSPQSETRSLSKENRMYWIDPDTSTIRQIAQRFGLGSQTEMIMFLPIPLEERLLRLELQEARNRKSGATEEEIAQTIFAVIHRGGDYDVRVSNLKFRN